VGRLHPHPSRHSQTKTASHQGPKTYSHQIWQENPSMERGRFSGIDCQGSMEWDRDCSDVIEGMRSNEYYPILLSVITNDHGISDIAYSDWLSYCLCIFIALHLH